MAMRLLSALQLLQRSLLPQLSVQEPLDHGSDAGVCRGTRGRCSTSFSAARTPSLVWGGWAGPWAGNSDRAASGDAASYLAAVDTSIWSECSKSMLVSWGVPHRLEDCVSCCHYMLRCHLDLSVYRRQVYVVAWMSQWTCVRSRPMPSPAMRVCAGHHSSVTFLQVWGRRRRRPRRRCWAI